MGEFRRGDGAVIESNRALLDIASLEAGHKAAFKVSGYHYGQGGTCRVFFVGSAERVVPHASITVATDFIPPALPTDR